MTQTEMSQSISHKSVKNTIAYATSACLSAVFCLTYHIVRSFESRIFKRILFLKYALKMHPILAYAYRRPFLPYAGRKCQAFEPKVSK